MNQTAGAFLPETRPALLSSPYCKRQIERTGEERLLVLHPHSSVGTAGSVGLRFADMQIPVFVSCPTKLSPTQEKSRRLVAKELEKLNLEWRALGRSDYPTELPLREVLLLARRCSGGVILGFEQLHVESGTRRRGTSEQKATSGVGVPSAWNHLEAGILVALGLPLLVFREEGVGDGVFDNGVTDVFVHHMPQAELGSQERKALSAVFQKWQSAVRHHYYSN
jgi:hypothetical protein